MEFSANNYIVQLCLQGMAVQERGDDGEAGRMFQQAWSEARDDYEKFLAAFFVARHQKNSADRLQWFEAAVQFALKVNDPGVQSALSSLYTYLAKCYEDLGDSGNAKKNHELARSFMGDPSDKGPFYHGTRADLQVGDLLAAGNSSNYQQNLTMNHIYFTSMVNGAGLAAHLAKGEGSERVYIVEPTGAFESDPNVTDKKFPGNLSRSYRSSEPLKIVGEVTDWVRQTSEELQRWRERLAKNQGEIIN